MFDLLKVSQTKNQELVVFVGGKFEFSGYFYIRKYFSSNLRKKVGRTKKFQADVKKN